MKSMNPKNLNGGTGRTKRLCVKIGKINDTIKEARKAVTFDLPKKFVAARERLGSIVKKADNKLPIRDDSKEVIVRLNFL